eukprot:SAG11_NODE_5408_length_1570_cov_1.501020_1_plen_200_part_00
MRFHPCPPALGRWAAGQLAADGAGGAGQHRPGRLAAAGVQRLVRASLRRQENEIIPRAHLGAGPDLKVPALVSEDGHLTAARVGQRRGEGAVASAAVQRLHLVVAVGRQAGIRRVDADPQRVRICADLRAAALPSASAARSARRREPSQAHVAGRHHVREARRRVLLADPDVDVRPPCAVVERDDRRRAVGQDVRVPAR